MWGAAHNGRLGLPTTEQRVLVPTLVEERPWGDRAVVHVACGADFTVGTARAPRAPPPRAPGRPRLTCTTRGRCGAGAQP